MTTSSTEAPAAARHLCRFSSAWRVWLARSGPTTWPDASTDLPLDLRRRFRTGRPCLDLVHTGGEGEYAVWEIVHTPRDLARWLALILELAVVHATADDLPPMRDLRAAVTNTAHAAAAGRPPARPAAGWGAGCVRGGGSTTATTSSSGPITGRNSGSRSTGGS